MRTRRRGNKFKDKKKKLGQYLDIYDNHLTITGTFTGDVFGFVNFFKEVLAKVGNAD